VAVEADCCACLALYHELIGAALAPLVELPNRCCSWLWLVKRQKPPHKEGIQRPCDELHSKHYRHTYGSAGAMLQRRKCYKGYDFEKSGGWKAEFGVWSPTSYPPFEAFIFTVFRVLIVQLLSNDVLGEV